MKPNLRPYTSVGSTQFNESCSLVQVLLLNFFFILYYYLENQGDSFVFTCLCLGSVVPHVIVADDWMPRFTVQLSPIHQPLFWPVAL